MTERPILFSGPMIRAIIDGNKTQTRRVVKPQPSQIGQRTRTGVWHGAPTMKSCPYGQPGDRLWVRESFLQFKSDEGTQGFIYKADHAKATAGIWKSAIHMPRWASRLTLEVKAIGLERLQEISENDAKAEGINPICVDTFGDANDYRYIAGPGGFMDLWDSINAERGYGWDKNPLVWVIEFRRVL